MRYENGIKGEWMKLVMFDVIQVRRPGRISTPGGDVLHDMKKSDPAFIGFREVYFSLIGAGTVKVLKVLTRKVLNLVVPVGYVR